MPSPMLTLPRTLNSRPRWWPNGMVLKGLKVWQQSIGTTPDNHLIEQCLYKIVRHNTVNYPIKTRLAILEILQQALANLFKSEKRFIRKAIAADEPDLDSLQQLDKLFEEFANGYKLIIQELADKKSLADQESIQVQEAIYYGLKFLAQRLLLAYAQYTTPAKGIWREINQIYRYAETHDLLYHIVDDPAPDTSFPVFYSGDFMYKRILLLALAEPYRLMNDECLELYNLCSRWFSVCSLFPIGELSARGEHIVDVADDLPPRFVTRDLHWNTLDGRLIDITEVIGRVEADLQRLLKDQVENMSEFELVDLGERQKRDMLFRVLDSYRGKPVRQARRFLLSDNIQFTFGINNCHYYLSNKRQYTPNMDELKHISRGSQEASDFAHRYKQALDFDRSFKWADYPLEHASQQNITPLGLAFSYQMPRYQRKRQINVGELIAYRSAQKLSRRWVLGVANWIKRKYLSHEEVIFEVGIKNLARNAIPITVREDDGQNTGSDYYRGLLIPKHVSHQQLRSLIVPALSFELNDSLFLNMGRTVMRVRLIRMLASSNAYSQFEFEMM